MTTNPRLIRLVTARFGELQGLFTLAGSTWAVYVGVTLILARRLEASHADVSDLTFVAFFGIPALGFGAAYLCWLRRRLVAYYAVRFGRVQGRFPMLGVSWIYQGPLLISLLADAHLPWLIILTSLTLVAAWPAWLVKRDWPYRWHWLPVVAVGVLMGRFMSAMPSYGVALRHIGPWWIAVGVSLAFAGALDHRLLVRTLRSQTREHEASEHA